jgi:hypothetical protein
MQHRLPGYDLTVGPDARGPHAARRLRGWRRSSRALVPWKPEIVGARVIKRRVMMRHHGVSVARGQATVPSLPPGTRPRRSLGKVGGGTGRPGTRARDASRGGMAQFVNLDKDPMERCAVSLAKGRAATGAGHAPVPVRVAQFANLDKVPMDRRAVGLCAATQCNCQGIDAGRWGARSCRRRAAARFRQIAQLPHATVRGPG